MHSRMRRRALGTPTPQLVTALAIGLGAGCAAHPALDARPPVVATPTEPTAPPVPVFPLPRATLVDRRYGPTDPSTVVSILRRADGRLIAAFDGVVELFDEDDRVVAQWAVPSVDSIEDAQCLVDGDRRLVYGGGTLDLVEGRFDAFPAPERAIACSDAVMLLASQPEDENGALRAAYRLTLRERDLDPGARFTRTIEVTLADALTRAGITAEPVAGSQSVFPRAIVGGHLAAVMLSTRANDVICSIDFDAGAVTACRNGIETVQPSEGAPHRIRITAVAIDAAAGRMTLGKSNATRRRGRRGRSHVSGVVSVDARTLEAVATLEDVQGELRISPHGALVAIVDSEGLRIYSGRTLEPIGETFPDVSFVALADDGFVGRHEQELQLFDASAHPIGVVSLDERPGSDGSVARIENASLVGGDVVGRTSDGSLIRARIGATSALRTMPNARAHPDMELVLGSVRFGTDGAEGWLTPTGLSDTAPDMPPVIEDSATRTRRSLVEALAPTEEHDVRAVAPASVSGAAYAELRGRDLSVYDDAGRRVGPPTRISVEVQASHCEDLQFLGDTALALSGQAPCIPTRIDFRSRRTSPLGPATVFVASTADGARVALLADHRVHLIDGRTGRTLAEAPAGVEHPRSVAISQDGRRMIVETAYSSSPSRVFDVSPYVSTSNEHAAATEPAFVDFPRRGGVDGSEVVGNVSEEYLASIDLAVTCDGGKLRIRNPFDPSSMREAELDACTRSGNSESTDPTLRGYIPSIAAFSPELLILFRAGRIHLVHTRDFSVMELDFYATRDEVAIAVLDGDSVIGVIPDTTRSVSLRVESEGRPWFFDVPASEVTARAAIASFLAR